MDYMVKRDANGSLYRMPVQREYRIRKLSDESGYIVIVLKGLNDVETLPKVYEKQREAKEAAKAHASHRGYTPLVIIEPAYKLTPRK